jgi:hypothetical protein
VAQDTAANDNNAAAQFSIESDRTAPTLTSFTRQTPATSPTNANTLIFRAMFDEDVTSVDAADFAVNGTTTATVINIAQVTASTYDVTVSGGDLAGFNGTVGLDLSGSQNVTDPAGNALPAGEPATDETYVVVDFDFGDAPASNQSGFANSYPTTLLNNGAHHVINNLFLGQTVDAELDGQPDAAAGQDATGGDDNSGEADEDGVFLVSSMVTTATTETTSTFAVVASQSGLLDAWIDFNRDGDWDDADEQIFDSVGVSGVMSLLPFTVPVGANAVKRQPVSESVPLVVLRQQDWRTTEKSKTTSSRSWMEIVLVASRLRLTSASPAHWTSWPRRTTLLSDSAQ